MGNVPSVPGLLSPVYFKYPDVAHYSALRIAGGRTFRLPNLYAHLHRGLTTVAIAMNSKGHVKKMIAGQAPSAIDTVCWILETEGCEAE